MLRGLFKLSLQLQKAAQHLRGTTLNVTAVLATLVLLVVPRALAATTATNSCQLKSPKGAIQHVIYVQFDNTHFRRDNPDIPSDLEQMPHLLNFIQDNGVLMSNDHTVLISHTATGILTSLTGVYPDRMGQPVSNSFRYFNSTDGTTRTGVSFAYWTSPLFDPSGSTTDTTPEMINENGSLRHLGCPLRGLGVISAQLPQRTQFSRTQRLIFRRCSAPVHPRRWRSRLILVKPSQILSASACIAPRTQASAHNRRTRGPTYCPTSLAITVISTVFSVPSTSIPSSSQADR